MASPLSQTSIFYSLGTERFFFSKQTDINTDFEEPVDMKQDRERKEEEEKKRKEGKEWQLTVGQSIGYSQNEMEGEDFKTCELCRRKIPTQNFDLHSVRCRGQ